MSTTTVQINFIIKQLNIYLGLFILIKGVIGGLLNMIVFRTLKTFRQTPCGFYLTVTSAFNVGQAIFALSTRILDSGFSINLTNVPWTCKLRTFLAQSCVLLSLTGMCLVTIDQFISMTDHRQWSSLRLAHRHMAIACAIWSAHGIVALIFWNTPFGICIATGSAYQTYLTDFYLPVLLGCIPIVIMTTFSLLAFFRIRTSASREINIVRLSRDRQLTAMALLQVTVIVVASVPYTIFNIYDLNNVTTNTEETVRRRLIGTVFVLLYYENFAVSPIEGNCSCTVSVDLILEFILCILLCIQTFSSTIALRAFQNSYPFTPKTSQQSAEQSNNSRCSVSR